jgi:hypothetical protein
MRAVEGNLGHSSKKMEREEGPRWPPALEDQSAPIPEETTSELGRIIWDTIVLAQFSHSATELFAPWKISFDQFILGVGYIRIVGRH